LTEDLDEWQREAERRAERKVVPVLMSGGAMEFSDWYGCGVLDPDIPLKEPDRGDYSSMDYDDAVIYAHMDQWIEWQLRHDRDLYITFCYPGPDHGRFSAPKWTFVRGPFTPEQLDEILKGRRINAVGKVPERFVAKYASGEGPG